ncbi:MAG TPA: elongation factor P [Deltaproteobacteria bacterium]|nr:elongation factor P [Deltaproteobacteria bacterium]
MISATQLRVGMIVKEGKELFRVTYALHKTPGNLRGFIQAKLRNISTGVQYEKRFSSEDRVEKASLDFREMEYLYEDQGEFHFMDPKTHEQMSMMKDTIEELASYLVSNQMVHVVFYEEKPISLELPSSVALRVSSTVPGLKSATVTASTKPATLETGLVVQVPQFINEGDVLRVDTTTGTYIERMKK